MNICVFGLWHLGCVTAACVAEFFPTTAVDPNPAIVADLRIGKTPILEPGLPDAISAGLSNGMLRFTDDIQDAVEHANVVWVAFDTPVDEEDGADVTYVENQIFSVFPYLRSDAIVLISSQMPVGSTRRIEALYRQLHPNTSVGFAYSPENLRLGKAIDVFRNPGRIVVGVRNPADRERLMPLLTPLSDNLLWMSVESAEMTKHALNAFLATSIVFINEIATLCEETGADAKDVETGLKTDERIGPRAYLGAGGPFAGGTLARDVSFLTWTAKSQGISLPLLESIRLSNDAHKNWSRRKLESMLGALEGKRIAVLGLTYKPGTSTLRRSAAVELCRWLSGKRTKVMVFDPSVSELPDELNAKITLCNSALEALKDSDAAVVATEWPEFRKLRAQDFIDNMRSPVVLDANRFLERALAATPPLRYIGVGMRKESA